MMCAVRRLTVALAGLVSLPPLWSWRGMPAAAGRRRRRRRRRCAPCSGPGVLDTPGGIALDAAGDLFVADTGHCRVLVVPGPHRCPRRPARRGPVTRPRSPGAAARGRRLPRATRAAWRSTRQGDVFIAEATAQRVQEVRAGSPRRGDRGGHGHGAASTGTGSHATASELDEPTGVAVDAAGDLFIADTANCRVRVRARGDQPRSSGRPCAPAASSPWPAPVCAGAPGRAGPSRTAQLWNPVAVTLDAAGDLLVADSGDQSVLLAPSGGGGTFYGIGGRRRRHRRGRGRHGQLRALRRRRAAGQRADRRAERPPRPGPRPDGRACS